MTPAWRRRWHTARSLGLTVLVVLLFRAMVAEAYVIPSGSMEPSLLVGDRVLVSKWAYGLRVPFTDVWLTRSRDPRPGDVVVFRDPQGGPIPLIKRVVAVGGDRVAVRDNVVHVNGQPLAREALSGSCWTEAEDAPARCERYLELLGGSHVVQQVQGQPLSQMAETRVPAGHLFLLGDNRDQSNDSRFWGTAPVRSVRGRALLVLFSRGPDGLRLDRSGRTIH